MPAFEHRVNISADAVLDALALLAKREILVGIGADGPDPDNAYKGYLNENGSPAANIPARPWLAPGIESVMPAIEAKMRMAAELVVAGIGRPPQPEPATSSIDSSGRNRQKYASEGRRVADAMRRGGMPTNGELGAPAPPGTMQAAENAGNSMTSKERPTTSSPPNMAAAVSHLNAAGQIAADGAKAYIGTPGNFEPLSPVTLKMRRLPNRKDGRPTTASTDPLVDSGEMRNSVGYTVRVK